MTSDSVPDIGRSLQHARTQAGLSLPEAAIRVGAASSELEALESGTVGRMADRIETLRTLRTYANSLDLPGDRFVLAVLELWPSLDAPARNGDTGVVPVVSSVTSAPAGGHSPTGAYGSAFTTSVNDASITGVVGSINDTRQVPIFETGQVPVVRPGPPAYLKVLVVLVALLIVVGGVGLGLHKQVSDWIHSAKSETTHLINKAKTATGITPTTVKRSGHHSALTAVNTVADPSGQSATLNVHALSFQVKVVVDGGASWVQVTDAASQSPVFSQVVQPGQTQTFQVTQTTTIETGSLAAHFLLYQGTKGISYYVPTKAPFTLTVNPVG